MKKLVLRKINSQKKTQIKLLNKTIEVYAGSGALSTLREMANDSTLYKGVKFAELLEVVYDQGKKDGARLVKTKFNEMMEEISHRDPGRSPNKVTTAPIDVDFK